MKLWTSAALALLLPVIVAAAPDNVPSLDVKTTCHSRGSTEQQGSDSCIQDELGAKRELQGMWKRVPRDVRQTCLDEVKIGGSPSYVELLTCSQMNEWSRLPPGAQPDRKAVGPVTTSPGRPAPRQ